MLPLAGFPWLASVASALMWVDAADTLLTPAVGWKPARIGFRQLFASSLYLMLVALGFLVYR